MSASSHGVRDALSRRPALSTSTSFRAAAAIAFLVFAANAAVSPLYRIYQAQFGFPATTLTLFFAVYIAVLLLTLLFLGSVSDYAGLAGRWRSRHSSCRDSPSKQRPHLAAP
jgi:hypothetical protein